MPRMAMERIALKAVVLPRSGWVGGIVSVARFVDRDERWNECIRTYEAKKHL